MSGTFDVNDRTTWDWRYEHPAEFPDEVGDYRLDMQSAGHFIQMQNGVAHRMPCPLGLIFNPTASPGPICDWPSNMTEEAIYDWAVSRGLVNNQR